MPATLPKPSSNQAPKNSHGLSPITSNLIDLGKDGVQVNESDSENTFDPGTEYIGNYVQVSGDKIYHRVEKSGKSDGRIYTLTY